MDTTFTGFLTSWDLRPEVILPQVTLLAIYISGWLRLRRKGAKIATTWRLVSYTTGMTFLFLALSSGIDVFQSWLFFMHMIQHEILTMIAPPLLFLAAPMPISFWGLPRSWRLQLGKLFGKKATFRAILIQASTPGFIWLVFTVVLWLWHDPSAYDAATTNQFIHDIEHLSFFFASMLLWWHITDAAPRIHKFRNYPVRMAIVALSYVQNMILGVGLALWGKVIYPHYANVPRVWISDPLLDQTYGGIIMWIPGGMMYGLTIIILIGLWIEETKQKSRAEDKLYLAEAIPDVS